MNVGTEDKKKLVIAGVAGFFAIFAVWYLYSELFGGTSAPAPPPPPVVTTIAPAGPSAPKAVVRVPGSAKKVGTTGGELDPTLHMEAMLRAESLVYAGSGRNIFAPGSPDEASAPKMEKVNFPVRPPVATAPLAPVHTGPPPPPPINLKYFGTSTSKDGTKKAFLLNGDDVFVASVGDVVQRRYRIVSISANSISVEDLPNSNKQTLPLVGQ